MRRLVVTFAIAAALVGASAPVASAGPVGDAACDVVLAARRAIGFYPMGSGTCPGGIEP